MSFIGEQLLKTIVSRKRRRNKAGKATVYGEAFKDYINIQFRTSRDLFKKFPKIDLANKRVLEIGCGTGGRMAYLASLGVSECYGIDINAEEIEIANKNCKDLFPELKDKLHFLVSNENSRVDIGKFDYVFMIDTLEHVISPSKMMRLAHSYLKPGGSLLSGFIGYYHHAGSHMGMMPFVNVFFSDETIINVKRWQLSQPDYIPGRFDSDPPVERWRGIYDLRDRPGEYLNKLTLSKAKKLVRNSIFSDARLFISGPASSRKSFMWINWLAYIPWIQEMFHSYAVVICRK